MWSLSSFNFLLASRKNYLRRDDCKSLQVVEHGLLERTCLMAQEMANVLLFLKPDDILEMDGSLLFATIQRCHCRPKQQKTTNKGNAAAVFQ